jgi:hypothetical protein
LHDMAPDELTSFLQNERQAAAKTLLELTPKQPDFIPYEKLWPLVMARHVVRKPEVNQIAASFRVGGQLLFPEWEKGKRVPQPYYKTYRP